MSGNTCQMSNERGVFVYIALCALCENHYVPYVAKNAGCPSLLNRIGQRAMCPM